VPDKREWRPRNVACHFHIGAVAAVAVNAPSGRSSCDLLGASTSEDRIARGAVPSLVDDGWPDGQQQEEHEEGQKR
jgi:hypothetical protein